MDSTSTPLADYFWIAGVESVSYNDTPQPNPQVESTIAEDGEPVETSDVSPNGNSKATARHSRQNSSNRLSKLSNDGRFSIHTLDELDPNTRSNRSSVTIRPNQQANQQANGNGNGNGNPNDGPLLGEFDFDNALLKFAAEREVFLEDLSFSAGAKTQARPPMVNPRAERIKNDETEQSGRRSPLRSIKGSIKGSIRRKMSFRDMNSMRKQPVTPKPGRWILRSYTRELLFPPPTNSPCILAYHCHSFYPYHETTEQLQFSDPSSRATQRRSGYAPA
jgi:hypothetical protein